MLRLYRAWLRALLKASQASASPLPHDLHDRAREAKEKWLALYREIEEAT